MILDWLDAALTAASIRRVGPLENPRVRPWASMYCAETTAGRVWVKAPGPNTAFEVALYPLLHRVAPDRVLEPIVADPARGLLLLPNGGQALAPDGLVSILPTYGDFQRSVAPHVDDLVAAGVADMRPVTAPARFAEAVALVGDVPAEVTALAPRVAEWAERLAGSAVPPSIDHNDLHPGNVFSGPRFYDWGDSVLAHPFASLLVPLDMSDEPDRARDAYLEAFTDLAPRRELLADLRAALALAVVARTHTWHRALHGVACEWSGAPRETLLSLAAHAGDH